jgi:uncharacterized protein YjbI with pentapeptide repeats
VDLSGADLSEADLSRANLSGANLNRAILMGAQLIATDLLDATLTGSYVYGVSVWDIKVNDRTEQQNLIITEFHQPVVTLDNINTAQFIYLLLNNEGRQAWGQVKYRCPGNTAQMGYDDLGQMTSRKMTLTATPFRPNRSLFPMTVEEGHLHQPSSALKKRDRSDKRGK